MCAVFVRERMFGLAVASICCFDDVWTFGIDFHNLNYKHYILHYYKVYDAMHNHSAKRCLKGAPLLKFMNKKLEERREAPPGNMQRVHLSLHRKKICLVQNV